MGATGARQCGRVALKVTVGPGAGPARDPFRLVTAALMWPGATRSILICGDGTLNNGEWITRLTPSVDGVVANPARALAYEGDSCPVVLWRQENGDIEWAYQAVALASPYDSALITSVEVKATNLGKQSHRAALEARFESLARGAPFVAPDTPESSRTESGWASEPATSLAQGWCTGDIHGSVARFSWNIAPGGSKHARVVIPARCLASRQLSRWAGVPHSLRVMESRRYWAGAIDRGLRLSLGDPEVEGAFREAVIVLLGCTQWHDGMLIPLGNPFQYRDVWIRDGARSVAALAMAGQVEIARDLTAGFLKYQWPQGPFLSQRGQLDGTGQALWAFEQVFLRPSPDSSVGRYANAAYAAWRWCEIQRASTRILGLPYGGLMPFCEPRDGELPHGRGQLIGTDAWSIAGYRATARLLEAAGRTIEAREVRRARSSYVAVFENTLSQFPKGDIPPSWQGIGRDWGNLSVVYPCGVLPPSHLRCKAVAERVWKGAPEPGLVRYGDGDSVHTYLSADLGMWALLDGRREDADRVLGALLRWRTASGGSPEIFDRALRDFGSNLPPHATAAAALITIIRNCLVFDDDDTLRLTLGARHAWWAKGVVRGAPTRWGRLDLAFSSDERRAEWEWTPVPVPTTLTLPPGTTASPVVENTGLRLARPDLVYVPAGVGHASIELQPAGPADR
jgi:hypothetical protein